MGRLAELAGDEDSGDRCKTFIFADESHTLGNALRDIISQYSDVEFCAYTVPHPAEAKMHFRIQAGENRRAIDILRRGLKELAEVCSITITKFEAAKTAFENKKMDTS